MTVKELYCDSITDNYERMKKMDKNSDEYTSMLDATLKMTDRYVEFEKIEADVKRQKHEKLIEIVKNGTVIGTTVMTLGVTIWGTIKSLKFEVDGTVTTPIGRGFINKLLPKK